MDCQGYKQEHWQCYLKIAQSTELEMQAQIRGQRAQSVDMTPGNCPQL